MILKKATTTTSNESNLTDSDIEAIKTTLKIKRANKIITGAGYTILESDKNKFLVFTNASQCNVAIPLGLAANLEFQGIGDIVINAESGGTLNYSGAFINETFDANSFFGIRTMGSDISQLTGTLKLS